MENTLAHIVNYEKTIFDKKKFKKSHMTSVNLKKILEYLKIQENLRSENLANYYLCKEIFLCFYLP